MPSNKLRQQWGEIERLVLARLLGSQKLPLLLLLLLINPHRGFLVDGSGPDQTRAQPNSDRQSKATEPAPTSGGRQPLEPTPPPLKSVSARKERWEQLRLMRSKGTCARPCPKEGPRRNCESSPCVHYALVLRTHRPPLCPIE